MKKALNLCLIVVYHPFIQWGVLYNNSARKLLVAVITIGNEIFQVFESIWDFTLASFGSVWNGWAFYHLWDLKKMSSLSGPIYSSLWLLLSLNSKGIEQHDAEKALSHSMMHGISSWKVLVSFPYSRNMNVFSHSHQNNTVY